MLLAKAKKQTETLIAKTRDSKVSQHFKNTAKPNFIDYALLGSLIAVCFFTFLYADIPITYEHSMNFLDALFSGNLRGFYEVAINNATYGHPAVYDIPIYIVFAIWNLPVYIIHQITGFNFLLSLPALLWLKTMLLFFTLAAAYYLAKIGKTLGLTKERCKWLVFIFLSAITLIVPVFVVVQYDIVLVVAMLAGINAYLKGNTKQFLLWFALANTLKLFSLFVFIPLILLKEKKLTKALGYLIIGLLGLVISKLIYLGDPSYAASTGGFTEAMLERLVATGFQWEFPGYLVPIFIVFIVGIIIFAYTKKIESEKELQAFTLYIPFSIFLVFCATVPLHPYWVVLLTPFAALILFITPINFKANLLLETAFGASITILYLMVGFQMYNINIFKNLVFGRLVDPAYPQKFQTPKDILDALGIGDKVAYLVGFMIAVALASLILNYPRKANIESLPNVEPIERSVIWARLTVPAGFAAMLFVVYLLPAPKVIYTAIGTNLINSETDLLATGTTFREQVVFGDDIKLAEINVSIPAQNFTWLDSSLVRVVVRDIAEDTILVNSQVPLNSIGTGNLSIDASGTTLKANQVYQIEISGTNGENTPLLVRINPEVDNFPTFDGETQVDGDLAFNLTGKLVK